MHTNINIQGSSHSFQYVIDYEPSNMRELNNCSYYGCGIRLCDSDVDIDKVVFCDDDINIFQNKNQWINLENSGVQDYLPNLIKTANITLYYPQYSVDTYIPGIHYAISLSTWIHGKRIVLGTFISTRYESLAVDKIKKFGDQQYYECHTFNIIDPYELTYSDSWKEFRNKVCGEPIIEDKSLNATGSLLHVSLYPVEYISGAYDMVNGYHGGQNSIRIYDQNTDFLRLNITSNIKEKLFNNHPSINCKLSFNEVYEDMLEDYLFETYGISDYQLKYELVALDDENIYMLPKQIFTNSINCSFDDIKFNNWNGYKEGICFQASMEILKDNETLLCIMSNKLPLTPELFKYFVGDDFKVKGKTIKHVNLEEVNMNIYNINTVNKIQQNVVQLNRANDSRSNIVQSAFYRITESSNVIIHPAVTETICINLDIYKSKVDSFMIQLEGYSFKEIGRTAAGVLFKIVGSKLPKNINEGTYYILNQDSEMITYGKYTYVS